MKIWLLKMMKNKEMDFVDNKTGLPHSKVVDKLNKLGINKISSKGKCDRIIDSLNNLSNNHKYKKIKNSRTKILKKSFVFILVCL